MGHAPSSRKRAAPRRTRQGTVVAPKRPPLGAAPILACVAAIGLLIVAFADDQATVSGWHPNALFWAGVLFIFVPHALRLMMRDVRQGEALALVCTLTLALYLVKVLHSPLAFSLHDEFLHWRTTDDIIQTGRLFADNPLLPTSARYPALDSATAALVKLGGISIFHAGLIVIATARIAFMLALYLTLSVASRSRRVAAIGTIVYMTNPNFLFFNAAFKYETIALTFAAVCVFLALRWSRTLDERIAHGLWLAAILAAGATAVSHHLAAVALTALLGGWSGVVEVMHRRGWARDHRAPWSISLLSALTTFGWIIVAAPVVIAYLVPVIGGAVGQGLALVARFLGAGATGSGERELFGGTQPGGAPPWERITALAGVGLVFLNSVAGGALLLRRRVPDPLLAMLLIGIPAYPATLLLRLTPRGWETANRSSEFLYVALAIPVAMVIAALLRTALLRTDIRFRARQLALGAVMGIMFIGGVVAGWSIQDRLPGPYLCCSAPRGVNPESVASAYWAKHNLPPFSRMGADPLNHLLIGSYGRQTAMTTLSGGIDPNWVIFARTFDADARATLADGDVRYMLVDRRVATAASAFDEYIGDWPVATAIAKFDDPRTDRIYDSGHIRIYDVSRVWHGR
ncbi:MAG: hypothetical protein ACR2I5_09010 [Candidatus Limnocylindria bacterium]